MYNVSKERFRKEKEGYESLKTTPTGNRRKREIRHHRKDLKCIVKQYTKVQKPEKQGLQQLRDDISEKIKRLRRAENLRKARKEKAWKRAQFIKGPFIFSKTIYGGEKSGQLESTKEEVEAYLRETHSDANRDRPYGDCSRIIEVEPPSKILDTKEL